MKTKELLADSFRSLVLTMPFQKISIKMITDGAHVIRPTFYNYFQDKYEVIEFLFDQDIGSKVEVMIENDMEQEAIKLMFICFEKIRNIIIDFLKPQARIASENFFHTTVNKPFSGFCPDIL